MTVGERQEMLDTQPTNKGVTRMDIKDCDSCMRRAHETACDNYIDHIGIRMPRDENGANMTRDLTMTEWAEVSRWAVALVSDGDQHGWHAAHDEYAPEPEGVLDGPGRVEAEAAAAVPGKLILSFDAVDGVRPWPVGIDEHNVVTSGLGADDGAALIGFGTRGTYRVDVLPETVRETPSAAIGLVATFANAGSVFEWAVPVADVAVTEAASA